MATSNVGKRFESDFKKSVEQHHLLIRLNDPPQSFGGGTAKFSIPNPCDYLLMDTKHRILVCFELKTTKYKSISYEDVNSDEKQNRMIHKHQISGLTNFSKYNYVEAGFLFNFRDEKNNCERTYFQRVEDFNDMVKKIEKHSCNELDILTYGGVKLNGDKKRVRYTWDIESLLDEIAKKYNN